MRTIKPKTIYSSGRNDTAGRTRYQNCERQLATEEHWDRFTGTSAVRYHRRAQHQDGK